MSTGLVCFLLKRANFEMPGIMGPTIHGGLVGGALGGLGGAVHGYMTAPDEVDENTGQLKSKLGPALSGAGYGALAGAGIGGISSMASGWNNNVNWLHALKNQYPDFHDKLLREWRPTNIINTMSGYQDWPTPINK